MGIRPFQNLCQTIYNFLSSLGLYRYGKIQCTLQAASSYLQPLPETLKGIMINKHIIITLCYKMKSVSVVPGNVLKNFRVFNGKFSYVSRTEFKTMTSPYSFSSDFKGSMHSSSCPTKNRIRDAWFSTSLPQVLRIAFLAEVCLQSLTTANKTAHQKLVLYWRLFRA